MSSGSGAPRGPVPADRDPNQADGDRHAEKGDNQGEGQPELQRSGSSSGNPTTANQQKSSRHEGEQSPQDHFSFGKSDQIANISDPVSGASYKNEEDKGQATSRGVDSYDRGGGAQGGDVAAAMASPEDTPNPPSRTQGKNTDSCPDFQNIDYSGHFKVNLVSRGTKSTVLKMKTEEERFVKFCHLFYCDLQLCAVEEALQSDLKLDVTKVGYPPSVCTQPGASDPVAVTVKSFLNSLCYQLSAVNISSTPWNIDQVRTILSSLDSYRKGIVIGYEVSGDEAINYWLAGEGGSMKSAIEVLDQRLGPGSNSVQQSSQHQDMVPKKPDRDTTDTGNGSSFVGQQERLSQTDSRLQQTGLAVSGQKQQQGPEQMTERTHLHPQHERLRTTNQQYQSEEEQASADSLRGKPGGSGSDTRPGGSGSDNRPGGSRSDNRQGGSGSDNRPGGSGSDNRPPGFSGPGDGHSDPTQPPIERQQERNGDPTRPSMRGRQEEFGEHNQPSMGRKQEGDGDPTGPSIGRQQKGIVDHTQPSMGRQQGGDGDPHGTGITRDDKRTDVQKEAENIESVRSWKEEHGDIPFADGDSEHNSSLTENQKEWSGQNANNPQQESTSAPVDQNIDRYQGQGQFGVHGDPVGAPTGGQNAGVQNMTEPSPGSDDQYKLPQGQPPSTKHDVHHETASSIITMKKILGRLDENILSSLPLILKDLRYKFKNVKIEWKKGQHTVNITGAEVDVRRVTTEIVNQLKAVKDNKVEINNKHIKQEALNMFREKSVFDYLRENIRSQEVACHLTKNEDPADVYLWIYTADTDRERAVRLVTSSVVCREIELDSYWKLFLESQYVQQELSDLQKEYSGRVAIKTQQRLVTLSCTADIEHKVLEIVNRMKKDFFTEGNKTVEYTSGGDLTVELCTKVQQHDIQMMEKKYGVKCHPVKKNRKQGWEVTGPRGTLEKACNTLKELSATVTSRHLPLVDKITEDFFKTQPGQDDMAGVGENTGCLVTLLEQEVADSTGTLGEVRSDIQGLVSATERSDRSNLAGRQWRSEDGRVVALYCGDGRNSTSDVLVELTQNKGTQAVRFQPYQDKVTVTLNLPEWKDGSNKEKDTIRKHFQEIIIMAAEKKYTSVTVLLDDCERCGWKERKACISLVKNTLYSLQAENAGACSCAYFVRDQGMFMALRDVIDDSFRNITQKYLYITDEKDEVALDWEHVDQSDIKEKKPEIIILKGELAKMTSQVIVNTTDTTLSLDYGAVSASILRVAGPQIQKECDQYYSGVKFGEVVITRGYKLKCKHVFHGALPSYVKDRQLKFMRSFVWGCLTEADKKKYSTISFPALGTGNLGYPRDLVAKTMFDTVNSYFNEGKDSSIETVSFVVYPKDTPTVKAFQDEEKKQRQKVLEVTTRVPTLPVSEKTRLQLRYGDVDLWVTVGQIERAAADGLLIFWDSTTLYKSPLRCSYFNENINPGGVNVLQSKREFLSSKGMTVVTVAGSLPFKAVIHCLIKGDNIDLQTVMSVLAEADSCRCTSVILSLGTKEPLTRLKAQFVNQFHDALKQLDGKNKALRRMEIMLDSVDTYKATESHIRSTYADRLVENRTVTGEEPLGATGGVQTRSMTRETNAQQRSAGNSTKRNLLVAGKLDSIEKAIQQLKNKISNVQAQYQTELTPSPTGTTIDQNSPKPERPPRRSKPVGDTKPAPKGSGAQDDDSSSPVTESTILKKTEYEERRLVLKSRPPLTLDKSSVEVWLKKTGSEQFTVVWPFLQDTEALIIFQSVNDAKKLLNKPSDQYTVNEFPGQTVQNLKATLKTAMVETIKKYIEPKNIYDKMFRASGATWCENNGTCFLEGSLPEIQCAYGFIVQLIAGGNVGRGNQQRSNTDGDRDGAAQGGTRRGEGPDSRGNGQNRHTNPDISNSGVVESKDGTRGGDGPDSRGNGQNIHTKDVFHGGARGSFSDTTTGHERQGSDGNTSLHHRNKNDETQSQDRESHRGSRHSPVFHTNINHDNVTQTTESNNKSVRGNEIFQDQECAPYGREHVGHPLQSFDGNKPDDIETKPHTTGIQGDPKGYREGAIKKTLYNERESKNIWYSDEEGQPSDIGNASLINNKGNLRSKEAKMHHSEEYQSGGFDNLSRENVDYNNAPKFHMSDDGRERGEHDKFVQSRKRTDEGSSIETVTCSAEQFHKICFFNPGIESAAKIVFNKNRTECNITDLHGYFKKAKSQLSSYARREIDNLSKTERGKFKKHFEHEKNDMDVMKLFCEYNPSSNQIRLVGEKYDAVQQAEQRMLEAIGRTGKPDHGKGCGIQPEQSLTKSSSKGRKRNLSPPELLQTKNGVRMFVYQADLLDLDVDAIVYGANSNLSYSNGLPKQIAQAAGPKFEEACSNIFAERGKLNAGDSCFSTAGHLHNQYIIHAVAPMWSVYKKEKLHGENRRMYQDDLCKTVMNALEEADNIGARSVALPAIGYGQCPSDVPAAAAREAVKLYCEKHKNSTLKEIHFVDRNEDILKKLSDLLLCSRELNVGASFVHGTTRVSSPQNKAGVPQGPPVSPQVYPKVYPSLISNHATGGTYMLSEHLSVCIMKGTYVKTKATALVSIEDELFQSERYIAKEISKAAAGKQYEKEIDTLRKGNSQCKISDVFLTGAGKIKNASHVLHVIGPVADKTISGNSELFKGFADNTRACIFQILKLVDKKELYSVALPTFASGTLQPGQTDQLWEICVEEVEKFATRQDQNSKLKIIFLVGGSNEVQLLLQLFSSKV
ncbi:uncharacterized protein LOC110452051 [Mizuhopecten yessoensis]|uniref:uncharacterized protein LOC110452051 n=1 Tax=Mizuhopecten yessoensis TaxID=6573 RepID=UPI000B45732E|nr:uncharacterized protein LOC110452051 [Mizuhopecten yessoensis]